MPVNGTGNPLSPIYQSATAPAPATGGNMAQNTGANITNSVPPAAQMTPVGAYTAAAGSVISTIGGLFKGSPEQNGKLPFEIEKQFILDSQNNLARVTNNLKQSEQIYQAYLTQYKTLQTVAKAGLPSAQQMAVLKNTNVDIAKAFGGSALDAIKAGFLDKDTARISGLIEDRAGVMYDKINDVLKADYVDPKLEQDLSNKRRQLMQTLTRNGASPQDIASGLAQFDQQAAQSRSSRTEEMRTSTINQLGTQFNQYSQGMQSGFNVLESGKNQNFNQAVTGAGIVQNAYNSGENAINSYANMNQNNFAVGNDYLSAQNNLMAAQGNIYNNIANTPLSLRTRGALGDKVEYSHGFLGMDSTDPAQDPASLNFRKQYQSAKQKRFATIT